MNQNLYDWAARWRLPPEAVVELQESLTPPCEPPERDGKSETAVQTAVRLEASRAGLRLWRNNVGGVHTDQGAFFRYGLANDSKAMNKKIKSSDLIGIRPIKIQAGHVGRTLGQFVAREVKETKWVYSGTEREIAQAAFLQLVSSFGGDAAFANGTGTIKKG